MAVATGSRERRRNRRRRVRPASVAAVLIALAFAALAACGSDEAPQPDGEPKRTVDPRAEALRFFPHDTEAVALVRVEDRPAMRRLDRALSGFLTWSAARDLLDRALTEAGIEPEEILELGRTPQADLDLPRPEIAAGIVPGSGPSTSRVQFALATEHGVEVDRIFSLAADRGGLEPAGEFDGARLYRGPVLDFAIRDGVVIAGGGVARLQQAIGRRDGDRDAQLDEPAITGLLNRLPGDEPLHIYLARTTAIVAAFDALLPRVEDAEGEAIESEAVGVGMIADQGTVTIDVIATLSARPEFEDGAPAATAEDPIVVPLPRAEIEAAIAADPSLAPLEGLGTLGPLAAAIWFDGSRARARIETSR